LILEKTEFSYTFEVLELQCELPENVATFRVSGYNISAIDLKMNVYNYQQGSECFFYRLSNVFCSISLTNYGLYGLSSMWN